MTKALLLSWILALAPRRDGHGQEIPRPHGFAEDVATVAMETPMPLVFAAMLDVLAAHESGYRLRSVGDGGRSCGAWQTPCALTPKDGLGQARLAVHILEHANDVCAGHPLFAYAAGRCIRTRIAEFYEREVHDELTVALPEDVRTVSVTP